MITTVAVRDGVAVPAHAISMRAVRSSGPGGQNVNKVASKVELRVDLAAIVGLDAGARARLAAACRGHLDADGKLLVVSQRTRDQVRNIDDALEKVRAKVLAALDAPRPRRKTRPSRGAVERRLGAKRHRAQVKKARGGSGDE